ncbi:MAG: aldehyde dehydrogenase family protein [Candidatus Omnitrophota bacterium]
MRVINPSTGEVITELQEAGAAEAQQAVAKAREEFDRGAWPRIPLAERKKIILAIAQGILENAGMLAKLETENCGKPIKETTFMDVPSSARAFAYFAEHLEEFLQAESRQVAAEAEARLLREPLGVAVLIVPWNYPLLIASWKVSQALAAGNCVILKPSSRTPLTALELRKIALAVGVPEAALQVIVGGGEAVGEALCADKRVDMISFTGSNAVGKKILNYASENVKKLNMELGGKSAGIILEDADLEAAVNGSLCSIMLNQGQMCTAMSRILVQEKIYDQFIADFSAKARQIKLGLGIDYQTQMGPLISQAQRKRVADYAQEALQEGAQLICGGKAPAALELKNGFFFEPTIFSGVTPQMAIFQQEVFGPVSCVSKFSTLQEAADLANTTDFALAASIWSKDVKAAQELAAKINAGTIWINTYGMFYEELPFGGFKQSGFGKELGKEGFLEYTRLKTVVADQSKDSKPLVNYWYGF